MTALSRFFCRILPVLLALFAVLPAQAAFTDNGNGTVTDTVTGLMWDKCSWGQSNNADCSGGAAATHTWTQALGAAVTANGANYKGYADWRLPNRSELESLVKIDAFSPAIDTTALPNTVSYSYWSSTNYAPDLIFAWVVDFDSGGTGPIGRGSTGYVRLVRSGQPYDSFDSQPGIAYSAATFTEAAANDGSISTSITLTLSGDTYVADVVSASRITASNVPAGLAANFVRTSATVITATLTGNATNHAHADDISNLTFTFADGAFTTTGTAANVNGYAKANLVVDFADPAAVAYSATTFTEAAANDGSITTSVTLTLSGDTYVADVVSANRITASNVPVGLAANFVRTSATVITTTLTGNATNHANANDIANLTFTFADGAFTTTATAANVTNYAKNNLVVDFADPAAVAYSATTFTEAAANDGSTSTSITLTLSGDTYVADVVSANRISASNVPAGLTANFVRTSNTVITATLTSNATNHANANDISNLTFTFVDGAFTTTATAANVTNYAKNDLVVDFADPVIAYSATTFTEAAANDGSIATSVTLTLSGDTYVADVVSANRITATNVPAGLAANFVRTSGTVITATLTGNATNHANANDISNLTFTFADGAFTTTGTAANVTNYAKNNLVVDFADPAAPVSSYDPGQYVPTVINAPSAANTTLTGTTPVNAALGSTLTIPAGASVSGVAITLAAPVAGVTVTPVTTNVSGNILTVTPTSANVVVTLKIVTINGVATPVLAVSSGAVTVSATAGQPLLTVSNNGTVVTAGTSGATVAFDGSGAAILSVTSGYVVLPTNAFAEVTGNNFAACKDGKVYAGEIVQIDASGKVPQVRLGSLTGSAVGDPLKAPSATGLTLNPAIPNLKGTVARLSATQDFTEVLAAALGATSNGQSGSGVLSLALPDGGNANVMPVGEITVDTNRADGVSVSGNGRKEVVKSGVIVNLVPAVSDITQFAGKVVALDKNASVIVNDQGVLQVAAGGTTFGLQPGWNVSKAIGAAGFSVNAQGWLVYQDDAGIQQTLYPVFIDLGQVVAALKSADANAGAVGNADGTITARFQSVTYTLLPDYALVAVPAARAKDAYWLEGGRVFVKNSDGRTAQGFGVK